MSRNYLFLLAFLFFMSTSCRKKAHKDHEEYIGEWKGLSYAGCCHNLNISDNSKARWNKFGESGCENDYSASWKVGKKTARLGYFRFEIVEEPHVIVPDSSYYALYSVAIDEPVWKMQLKCDNFYCDGAKIILYRN